MVVICIKFGEAGIVFGSLPIEGSDCEDTEVTGLSFCPNLADMLPILLENKRSLLRLSLDALTGTYLGHVEVILECGRGARSRTS